MSLRPGASDVPGWSMCRAAHNGLPICMRIAGMPDRHCCMLVSWSFPTPSGLTRKAGGKLVEVCSTRGAMVDSVVLATHTGVCLTWARHVAWMVMGIVHARPQVDGACVLLH